MKYVERNGQEDYSRNFSNHSHRYGTRTQSGANCKAAYACCGVVQRVMPVYAKPMKQAPRDPGRMGLIQTEPPHSLEY